MNKYILRRRVPVEEPDVLKWAAACEKREWPSCVGETEVLDYTVHTSFLGIDHNWGMSGIPIVFETMVSTPTGDYLDYQERYPSWEEAEAGHERAIQWLRVRLQSGKPVEEGGEE